MCWAILAVRVSGFVRPSQRGLSKQHRTHGAGRDEETDDPKPIEVGAHVIHAVYPLRQAWAILSVAIDACELEKARVHYYRRHSFQGVLSLRGERSCHKANLGSELGDKVIEVDKPLSGIDV